MLVYPFAKKYRAKILPHTRAHIVVSGNLRSMSQPLLQRTINQKPSDEESAIGARGRRRRTCMARTRAEGLATGAKPWTPAKAVAAIASMENFMVTRVGGFVRRRDGPQVRNCERDVGKDEASGRLRVPCHARVWREMQPRCFCTDSYVGFTESNIRHWPVGEKTTSLLHSPLKTSFRRFMRLY